MSWKVALSLRSAGGLAGKPSPAGLWAVSCMAVALAIHPGLALTGSGSAVASTEAEAAAKAAASETAAQYLQKGFSMREEFWSGSVEPSQTRIIRHQLYRGNEYWFWVATEAAGCEVTVDVFDADGHSVSLEKFAEGDAAGARVLPSKTGAYLIRIAAQSEAGLAEVPWALIYGYR